MKMTKSGFLLFVGFGSCFLSANAVAQIPQLLRTPIWRSSLSASMRYVSWVDINADGYLDLATSGNVFAVYRNMSGTLDQVPAFQGNMSAFGSDAALGDYNGDGYVDFAAGSWPHLFIYAGAGDFTFTLQDSIVDVNEIGGIDFIDLDDDGDLDLSVARTGFPVIYENRNGRITSVPLWTSSVSASTTGESWGDIDNDGDLDLAISCFSQSSLVYRNIGGMLEESPSWASLSEDDSQDLEWVDYDGDGDLDLSFANWGRLTIYQNYGDGLWTSPSWYSPESGAFNAIAWGDYDHDGDPDMAVSIDGAPDRIYRNDRGVMTRTTWSGLNSLSTDMAWGDYDNDGDLDLAFAKFGKAGVYRNDEATLEASLRDIIFPTLTQGDTASVSVTLTNGDTVPLVITGARLSTPQAPPAFVIDPGFLQAIADTLTLEPDSSLSAILMFIPSDPSSSDNVIEIASRRGSFPQLGFIRVSGAARALSFGEPNLFPSGVIPHNSLVIVSAVMDPQVDSDSATVFYRAGGGDTFIPLRMVDVSDSSHGEYVTEIAPDVFDARGLDYFVQVRNGWTSRDGPTHSLRVEVENEVFPFRTTGRQYRLISMPFDMQGPILGSFADDLGGPDVTKWRMFAYNTNQSKYVELPNDSSADFQQGRSYWLITSDEARLDSGPSVGISTPTTRSFAIPLVEGWNLISNPFRFPVRWNDVTIEGTSAAVVDFLDGPIGIGSDGRYDSDVTVLDPFVGYWVKSYRANNVALEVPPLEATDLSVSTAMAATDWRIEIQAAVRDVRGESGELGVERHGKIEWDLYDVAAPPLKPADVVAVYFPHNEWKVKAGAYRRDVRSDVPESATEELMFPENAVPDKGYAWRFDVAKNFTHDIAGDIVRLSISGIGALPSDANIHLVDRTLARIVDFRRESTYEFLSRTTGWGGDDKDARFALLVGGIEYVGNAEAKLVERPRTNRLIGGGPNPFNPTTIIRYEIASDSKVVIRIYDVRGQLVRELEDLKRPAGRYEVVWRGDDGDGHPAVSGVYFCVFEAGAHRETRKLVLVK